MKEIIKYQDSPISIPHPDEAWKDMRTRLKENTPDPLTAANPGPASTPDPYPVSTPDPYPVSATDPYPVSAIAGPARPFITRANWITLFLLIALLWPIYLPTTAVHPSGTASITVPSANVAPTRSPIDRQPGVLTFPPYFLPTHPNTGLPTDPAPPAPTLSRRHSSTRSRHKPPAITGAADASGANPGNQASVDSQQPANNPTTARPAAGDSITTHTAKTQVAETQIQQNDHFLLQLGLQWTAQVPTGNAGSYLAGISGHSRPYRVLLPAAWMHLQLEKSLFEVTLDPFYSNLVPARPFSQGTNTSTRLDTTITISQSKTLNKLFGLSASIGYAASLGGNWWAGGGIQTTWWTHAIATTSTDEEKEPLNNPSMDIKNTSRNTSALNKTDWSNFFTFQLNVFAQLLYNKGSWHTGFRIGIPFNPISKNDGPGSPLRMEFFYRLPLLSRQIRAAATPE